MADSENQEQQGPSGKIKLDAVGNLFIQWHRQAASGAPQGQLDRMSNSVSALQDAFLSHLSDLSQQGKSLADLDGDSILQAYQNSPGEAQERFPADHQEVVAKVGELAYALHQDNPKQATPFEFRYDAAAHEIVRNGDEAAPAVAAEPTAVEEPGGPQPMKFDRLSDLLKKELPGEGVNPDTLSMLRASMDKTLKIAQASGVSVDKLHADQVMLQYQNLHDLADEVSPAGSNAADPAKVSDFVKRMVDAVKQDNPGEGRAVVFSRAAAPVASEMVAGGQDPSMDGHAHEQGHEPPSMMDDFSPQPSAEGGHEEGAHPDAEAHERDQAEIERLRQEEEARRLAEEAAALGLVTDDMPLGQSLRSVGLRMAANRRPDGDPTAQLLDGVKSISTKPSTFEQVSRRMRVNQLMKASREIDRVDAMMGGRRFDDLSLAEKQDVEKLADKAFKRLRKGMDAKGLEYAMNSGVSQNEIQKTLDKARQFSEEFKNQGFFKNLSSTLSSVGSMFKSVVGRLFSSSSGASKASASAAAPSAS